MKTIRLLLLACLALPVGLACSAAVRSGDGEGGSAATSTTATGAGGGGGAATSTTTATTTATATTSTGGGACSGPADCANLDDQCNTGACVDGHCQKLAQNEFGSCDDGLFCTDNDSCQAGVCTGGTKKFCSPIDQCHVGQCNEATQLCENVAGNDGAQCDDSDSCTYSGVCGAGTCQKGPPVDCTVYDSQCTKGVCDAAIGCYSAPANEGQGCNDQLYCTIDDTCKSGACSGAPNTCAAPGDVCMIGSCDEANDKCTAIPGNNGNACNDGNLCTSGETCLDGTCLGGQPANNGAACEDADGCTGGTTCSNGTCTGAVSVISQCISGDSCCPAGGCPDDTDCLYWEAGVQQNVPIQALTGWTQCFSTDFGDSFTSLGTILAQCSKPKLLLGCMPAGSQTLTLAAMAPRADVLFECGSQSNCTQQSNGVGWYYSNSYSWGFAPGGAPVNRNSCDFDNGAVIGPELRMCWHTGGNNINSGYRCGTTITFDGSWQRLVFQAD